MSLLKKLKAGTKNQKTIKYPGTDQDITMRILSEGGCQASLIATEQHFKKHEISLNSNTAEAYEAENTLQILYRAISDDSGSPLAKSVDEFRELISLDEKNILVDEYLALEHECSPNPDRMSDDEFSDLIQRVKKNAKITVGNISNIAVARKLIIYLARELWKSPVDNGSIS